MTAIGATAEVQRFDEALSWFRQRIPMTTEMRDQLDDWAGARAWWVAGAQHLDLVMAVHVEISNAIDLGTPPHELVKRLEKLLPQLTKARLETIARTNLATAFNAGRWEQMTDPDMLELRPYWQFDAILDGRTTDGCRALDGVALPNTDPFWLSNWPPRHHRCRSQVRAIKARDYAKLPESKRKIPVEYHPTAPGFGLPPSVALPWRPDPAVIPPPEVKAVVEKKQVVHEVAEKKAKVEVAKKVERKRQQHERWLDEYARYGEAAEALARGRAAVELGLDEKASVILDEVIRLQSEGYNGIRLERLKRIIGTRQDATLREILKSANMADAAHINAVAGVVGHVRTITARKRNIDAWVGRTGAGSDIVNGAERFYSVMADASITFPSDWSIEYGSVPRAKCYPDEKAIALHAEAVPGSAIHELGHALEAINPGLARRALAFLEARTRGENPVKLSDLHPNDAFRDDEVTRPDKFADAYMGKVYEAGWTEITSLLTEWMTLRAYWIWEWDEEAFLFAIGTLETA